MDFTPPRPTTPVAAYPRSALDDFVASATVEERRLEQAIAEARTRTQRATFAAEESEATSELLRSKLHDLRREFADRRLQVEAQAEGLIAAARDEASQILAEARRAARPRVFASSPPAEPRPQPSPAPAESVTDTTHASTGDPQGSAAAAAPTPAAPPGGPARPVELPGNGTAMTPTVAAPPAEPTPRPPINEGTAGGAVTTNGERPGAATTIDLTDDGTPRGKGVGLTSRLRRGRHRDEMPEEDAASDEFLDFLRGALVDDSPLDHSAGPTGQVDWRWTS